MARQKNGKWIADFVLDGQRKRIQCDTKQDAERLEAQPKELAKRLQDPTAGDTFQTWARMLWEGTRDEKASFCIVTQLINDLGPERRLKSISQQDVEDLKVKWQERGNSPRTVNTKLAKLSKLFNHAVDFGILDWRPKTKFNKVRKGRIRALSSNEEGALLGSLKPEFAMFAQFLLYTGARVSEALHLDWKDVDFENDSVTFWDTKNGDERTIPLVAKSREALIYANDHMPGPKPWSAVMYDTFIKAWRRAKREAGLGDDPQVVPHVLRHTCATRLGKGRMDPLRLQKWMGHTTLDMTKRYTHLDVDDLRKASAIFERS